MHTDLWFVHILVYQYWLWFIFIFIRHCNEKAYCGVCTVSSSSQSHNSYAAMVLFHIKYTYIKHPIML
jgi:hypothetical protein